MPATNSYAKAEKLKSRKALKALFTGGKSFAVFPVKVFWMPAAPNSDRPIQAGVGVSARHFKKAVDRNRIKRLLRECYRLNKHSLLATLEVKQKKVVAFFLYVGKELPDYTTLNEKMQQALTKFEEQIVR
jgi:ribonuclease P protein component